MGNSAFGLFFLYKVALDERRLITLGWALFRFSVLFSFLLSPLFCCLGHVPPILFSFSVDLDDFSRLS